MSKLEQTLTKIWDGTNNTLLIYDAALNQVNIKEYVLNYRSLFTDLVYNLSIYDPVAEIISEELLYGAFIDFAKVRHYCLGKRVYLAVDGLELTQAVRESEKLLREQEETHEPPTR